MHSHWKLVSTAVLASGLLALTVMVAIASPSDPAPIAQLSATATPTPDRPTPTPDDGRRAFTVTGMGSDADGTFRITYEGGETVITDESRRDLSRESQETLLRVKAVEGGYYACMTEDKVPVITKVPFDCDDYVNGELLE